MNKPRLLIVGCGDVVRRALPWLKQRFTVYATARTDKSALQLNTLGVIPIYADLDHAQSLRRLRGIAQFLIHSAPPGERQGDARTKALLAALGHTNRSKILPQGLRRAVYISTSGVYGDCGGEWIDETQPLRAQSTRALRRVDAETQLRNWAGRHGVRLSILRAPGIYAAERLPLERVRRGDPVLHATEDSYSNHIHADDLAHALCLALFRGLPLRTYNIVDDEPHKMGDYFDQIADYAQLARPPRISRAAAQSQLSPALLSYLNESRQISNARAKRELRLKLAYPTLSDFIAQHC
ncbi:MULTISPECIES: NAD-dependent epimerase/dehydratase family protein [Deefgea]|uniref:NAD-dependent epimerase/dehydratase family protein n=1 Tax=Deefgea chitinilytica TaxID=570276 RepID=A0ABS2CB81_9NEIS|nr:MULTISPECIES: NAD-dependent epimerase/dehydratase family protein [Deefgea]MBM5571411.1 NAD-dependent epimerase/dehydratase family protein [Deefgea chitinilytica]MBM9888644.1 NAD-dependent epimerase/dehydratase family protein [Deefgea sp. CFH1-16]